MKLFSSILITILLIGTTSCGPGPTKEEMKYSGIIEAAGITSYQYGTHTIKTDDAFFALKSDSVDLKQFEGESVNIIVEQIEGYPMDVGPKYLNVLRVTE